ncbi:ABC transporter ATP-binding protein [Pseudonocardia ailaonensis]|uniref:ABC transporter ATP-binding protein n=1 Tax=Pseudonocardia ailaonensis TaxID=367279 RepID=A0ABN2N6Y7_9PSEU
MTPVLEVPLLDVTDLRVTFGHGRAAREVVHGVSFTLAASECVAIVGESGSGKSVTARSLLGLAGIGGTVHAGRLDIAGEDARAFTERRWRQVRGGQVGLVLQDALGSLDPVRKVAAEITDALRTHRTVTPAQRPQRVHELLAAVGVPDPEIRAQQYPHQLSGGLRQRALIATAIAADPAVLVADEPTTALDVTVQAQVLDLLAARKDAGMALLLISHDLAVVSRIADRVLVMKDGEVVESGPGREVLGDPRHAYTRRLIAAVPSAHPRGSRLSLDAAPAPTRPVLSGGEVVLEAHDLRKVYATPDGGSLTAVDGVSLAVRAGRTVGVVGESGSGKTTTGHLLFGYGRPDGGTVSVDGRAWADHSPAELRRLHQRFPVVHQDPAASFDPRYTVGRTVAEPLQVAGVPRPERRRRVAELLGRVGLDPALAERHPRQLSGGQRQRVAIARALALEPRVVLCDEPVSALDVSVQAQILDLLADLQATLGIAYVFISHDLGVVRHVSDEVLVMQHGRVVEQGDVEDVFERPQHPYTKSLLDAVPTLDAPLRAAPHPSRSA